MSLAPLYQQTRQIHADCHLCGDLGPLRFALSGPGQVSADFTGRHQHQGYPGLIHGGIISSLLDAAMTHCLFSLGHQALTAELQVRFLAPAPLQTPLRLTGRLLNRRRQLFQLEAELCHGTHPLARASAKFLLPAHPLARPGAPHDR